VIQAAVAAEGMDSLPAAAFEALLILPPLAGEVLRRSRGGGGNRIGGPHPVGFADHPPRKRGGIRISRKLATAELSPQGDLQQVLQ
jgi:hypothetical protein